MTPPDVPCPHRRVREHGAPRLVKGPAGGTGDEPGHHVSQSATCLDCGWPLLRTSEHVALGAWQTVAGGTPQPRYRRHGQRYGSGMDDAA